MLNDTQIQRMLRKLRRYIGTLESMIFEEITTVPAVLFETSERLHNIPDGPVHYREINSGDQ